MSTQAMSVLGHIPASVGTLELNVQGAMVSIYHEDRTDIALKANHPSNWTIRDGSVRQIKVQEPLGGGNVVIGGSVSGGVIISGSVSGGVISTGRGTTVVRAGGRNVSIINGEVYVDGKKVTGSEESTSQSGPSNGPDRLEVLVPKSFRGGLSLSYEDGSKVDVDNWQGGDVSFASSGGDNLTSGRLTGLSSFVLQSTGSGDFSIEAIETQSFMATKTGSGDLDIEELNTRSLLLTQTGSGDTSVRSGAATTGSVSSTGSGDVSMRGRFGNINKRSIGSGEVTIRVRE